MKPNKNETRHDFSGKEKARNTFYFHRNTTDSYYIKNDWLMKKN
jgi:hypothetical protein